MDKKWYVVGLIVVLLTAGGAIAATQLTSNSLPITPQPTPTPATLTLTANTTQPYIGEKALLTVVLSSHQQGIAIDFNMNGTKIGTVGTDSQGIATYVTPQFTADTQTWTATCTIP